MSWFFIAAHAVLCLAVGTLAGAMSLAGDRPYRTLRRVFATALAAAVVALVLIVGGVIAMGVSGAS